MPERNPSESCPSHGPDLILNISFEELRQIQRELLARASEPLSAASPLAERTFPQPTLIAADQPEMMVG